VQTQDFDNLAKALATKSISRRDALKWVGGALLGGWLASIPARAFAAPPPLPGSSSLSPQAQGLVTGPGIPSKGRSCPPGLTYCRGKCFDLSSDPCNCGACGNVCAGSGVGRCCFKGKCTTPIIDVVDCPSPFSRGYCQEGVPAGAVHTHSELF